jgi:hypothetical protein
VAHTLLETPTFSSPLNGGIQRATVCRPRRTGPTVQQQPRRSHGREVAVRLITRFLVLLANTSIDPAHSGSMAALAVTCPVGAFQEATADCGDPVGHAVE